MGTVGSVGGTFGSQEQQLLLYTPYVADSEDYYVTTEHRKHQVNGGWMDGGKVGGRVDGLKISSDQFIDKRAG